MPALQAQMAELVDAPGSGPGGGNTVEVRVLFWAPAASPKKSDKGHKPSKYRDYGLFLVRGSSIHSVDIRVTGGVDYEVTHHSAGVTLTGVTFF